MTTIKSSIRRALVLRNVQLVYVVRALIRCGDCSLRWSSQAQSGSRMPPGGWKCSAGCNVSAA